MISLRRSCFCAFCKTPRKVYSAKHLTSVEVAGLIFFSLILTFGLYQSLEIRGLFLTAGLLMAGEVFSQLKWRASMICRNCGFDPVVYIQDPEQAGLKIKAFMKKRSDSPGHLLRDPVLMPVRSSQKV